MLGQEHRLGQIKKDFEVDLLVLAANPIEEVTILEKPEAYVKAVMKEGRVYKSRWTELVEDSTAFSLKSAL